ncbi:unnamed protein product [marine sediment metagenome]|uniref:Uncharacterized protein n=1 Tax=marine sediment metagenome TaxID=412755 RepID=X0UBT7_9ZZZZ
MKRVRRIILQKEITKAILEEKIGDRKQMIKEWVCGLTGFELECAMREVMTERNRRA